MQILARRDETRRDETKRLKPEKLPDVRSLLGPYSLYRPVNWRRRVDSLFEIDSILSQNFNSSYSCTVRTSVFLFFFIIIISVTKTRNFFTLSFVCPKIPVYNRIIIFVLDELIRL